MSHLTPTPNVGGHARMARNVVRRVLETANELIERDGGSTSSAGEGGGATTAAAAAKAQAATVMANWNQYVGQDLNIVLALCVALVLFATAPLAASWFANGRYRSGWVLRSGSASPITVTLVRGDSKGSSKSGWSEKDKGDAKLEQAYTISDRPLPLRIQPVNAIYACFRTLYNKLLLPTSPFFGLTVGQVLVCLGYEAVVLVFMFYRCLDHKTDWKRTGVISVAQLPALFLFATKNSLLTCLGKGYEKLNFLHRVAGRLCILCALLHTLFFFLNYPFDPSSTAQVTGMISIVVLCVMLVTSVSYFRKAFYQVFLVSHIVGWLIFLVALDYHVSPVSRPYTFLAIAIYCLDFFTRVCKTRFGLASIVALPGGTTMVQSHKIERGWRAGQHVWLRVWKGWRGWETHPFTVANAPQEASPLNGSHKLTLLVKAAGDYTRGLNDHAKSNGGFSNGAVVKCALEGPYGGPMYTDFADVQAAVLFAGGSGITFAASVLEELVGLAVKGRLRTRTVTVVWSFRDIECLQWYQSMFDALLTIAREQTCLDVRLFLHVTHPPTELSNAPSPLASPIPFSSLCLGRPDPSTLLNTVVDDVLETVRQKALPSGGGVAVGTCGPKPLVTQVRKAVAGVDRARSVKSGGIVSYSETFGW
ncbi:hypothetical protein JCM5296_001063 [Sporobolomyces johnsonii]